MADRKVPLITRELVEWLEALFPVRIPGPREDLSQIMFDAGTASVARKVRNEFNNQQKEP